MRGAAGTGAASPSPSAAVSPPATAAAALDSTLSRDSDGRWADAGLALALLRWLDALVVHAMVEPAATVLVHSTAAELAPHAGADSGGSGGGEGGGATFCEVALAMQLLLLQEGGGAQPAGGGAADGGAGPLEPARQLDELLTRAAVWCERPFLEPSPQQQPSRGTPTLSSRGGSLLSGRDPSTRVGSFESTGSGQDSAAEAAGTWQLRQLGRAIGVVATASKITPVLMSMLYAKLLEDSWHECFNFAAILFGAVFLVFLRPLTLLGGHQTTT